MRNWTPWIAGLVVLVLATCTYAQEAQTPKIWQIPFGTQAETLDRLDLIDPACGTNGGPPGLPLTSFEEYAKCAADETGYHEVWYRHDDTLENMARALRNPIQIGRYLATAIAGHPVVLSLLLDDEGRVRGYRVFTDDRTSDRQRSEAYALSANLRAVLGQGWSCVNLPAAAGEEPIERVFVKQDCTLENDRLNAEVSARYLFKPGQHIVDPATGKPTTGIFESTTRMQVLQAEPLVDEPVMELAAAPAEPPAAYGEREMRFLSGEIADCAGCELEGADLRRRDLTGADLSGANLSRATLHRATLRQADLSGSNLSRANFNLAELSLTDFTDADLTEALFYHARGTRTDFTGANLDKAKMGEIGLRQAVFTNASLRETDLGGADLNRSDFSGAVLDGSYLFQIRLLGANLTGIRMHAANLDGALLREADLTDADLTDSDLQHADLRNADLTGANFTHVRLSFANLRDTIQRGTDFTDALMPR